MINERNFVIASILQLKQCWPSTDLVTPYDKLDLSIVPGPLTLNDRAVSFDDHDVVEYPPEHFAEAVLAVPNSRCLSLPNASWWEWKAQHDAPDGYIKMDMTLFETDPPSWGGSLLDVRCSAASLLAFWLVVRQSCPATWLHDTTCKLYSPETFRQLYVHPAAGWPNPR